MRKNFNVFKKGPLQKVNDGSGSSEPQHFKLVIEKTTSLKVGIRRAVSIEEGGSTGFISMQNLKENMLNVM